MKEKREITINVNFHMHYFTKFYINLSTDVKIIGLMYETETKEEPHA